MSSAAKARPELAAVGLADPVGSADEGLAEGGGAVGAPLGRAFAARPAERGFTGLAGRPDACDVYLVGVVERVGRVARQDVGEPGSEAAAHDHGRPGVSGRRVERQERVDPVVVVARGSDRDASTDRFSRYADRGVTGHGERHRTDRVRDDAEGNGLGSEDGGELLGPLRSPVGHEELLDTGGFEELPGGADTDRAGTGEQDRRHRKSGPSSSRQPPVVGGLSPLLRRRTTIPASSAQSTMRIQRR